MRKPQKYTSISKVVEVSDEEYRRLANEANAKLRTEARKHLPRSERQKAPIEASLVSDEEYARLAQSATENLRRENRPKRNRRAATAPSEGDGAELSPEEYQRLSEELISRSEEQERRQERLVGNFRWIFNPITIAIVLLGGICLYFLITQKHLTGF